MSIGLIGRKIGMTQVFDENGSVIPVTLIEAGPCYVLENKTVEKNGYQSVLIGFQDRFKNVRKPQKGFYDKIKVFPKKHLKEFRLNDNSNYNIGDQIRADIFSAGEFIDVTALTKGRGFQGVIKRHNQSRGPMTHGSRYHRRPGSMGACADPSRVFKGKNLPGHMGMEQRTMQRIKVVDVRLDDNLILIKGSIPGFNNGIVYIRKTIKK